MGVITRSNHPDALWPGVKAWFGKTYAQQPMLWTQMFEKESSDKYQEIVVETTGFGMAAVKAEGASISYDSDGEGYKNTFTHVVRGLGYIVTREEQEDDLYVQVSKTRGKALAMSINSTVETVHANILNNGFSGSYTYGDSVALFSTSHPTRSGNQSNIITAADLSETSLESMLTAISNATNNRGLRINLMGKSLWVSTTDQFNAERIVNSTLRPGSANNDINATKAMGMLPEGILVNPYFSDADAWFIQTNAPSGLLSYWRREAQLEQDNDFDTENAKAKSTVRFQCGPGDFRGVYGSQGV